MDAVLKKSGHTVRLGEFETCPNWGPSVDTHRRPTRISLKGLRFHQFDHSVSWPTKVRNVSRPGSHPLSLPGPPARPPRNLTRRRLAVQPADIGPGWSDTSAYPASRS